MGVVRMEGRSGCWVWLEWRVEVGVVRVKSRSGCG